MDTLLPLVGFAIVTSVTPGPNTLIVTSAAANGGVRGALPLVLGICVGFATMHLVVGLGLAGPFAVSTTLHGALRWIGALVLVVLAWRVAQGGLPGKGPGHVPLGFLGGAAFQWVNVKSWVVAIAAVPAFTVPGTDPLVGAGRIAAAFLLVGVPCLLIWAGVGAGARHWLDRPGEIRAFNIAMAVLLVISVVTMFA